MTTTTTTKTGTEIFNENNNITFEIEKNEKHGDFRINKLVNGEWDNQYDGNWNEKQANLRLFAAEKGMSKAHYNATILDRATVLGK